MLSSLSAFLLSCFSAASLTASLTSADKSDVQRVKRQQEDACDSSIREVRYVKGVQLLDRYASVERPWLLHDSTRIFTGDKLLYNWAWIKANRIRGLDLTLSQLIYLYDHNQCLMVAWGAAVRNALLAAEPVPISVEVSCSIEKIYRICRSRFGAQNCQLERNATIVLVGNPSANKSITGEVLSEPLRLYAWRTLSARPLVEWDYSANALGLYDNFANGVYLIDPTGTGQQDACSRFIRPTVEPLYWLVWAQDDLARILRYYELASYGLIPISEQLERLVVNEVSTLFNIQEFERFVCETVLEGFYATREGGGCALGVERRAELSERRVEKVRDALREDFTAGTRVPLSDYGLFQKMSAAFDALRFVESVETPHSVVSKFLAVAVRNDAPEEADEREYYSVAKHLFDRTNVESAAVAVTTPVYSSYDVAETAFIFVHKPLPTPTQLSRGDERVPPPIVVINADDRAEAPASPRVTAAPPPYISAEEAETESDAETHRVHRILGLRAGHPYVCRPFAAVLYAAAEEKVAVGAYTPGLTAFNHEVLGGKM